MSEIRIFQQVSDAPSKIIIKDKELIHKLKNVLRMKEGEELFVFNGTGKEFKYILEKIGKKDISLVFTGEINQKPCSQVRIFLAIPILHEKKIDLILQKSTELGVDTIILYISERSLSFNPSKTKFLRWNKIIEEASRQSRRLWVPKIEDDIQTLPRLAKQEFEYKLFCSHKGETIEIPKIRGNILVVIGPEGDFSHEEYILLKKSGFYEWKLSENTLRTETAAIFSVGLLRYKL